MSCVCNLDILKIITSIPKVFESEALMPNKVKPLPLETVNNVDDCIKGEFDHQMLLSHLASFRILEGQLTSTFIKADDPHKRNVDKVCITYEFENMTSLEHNMLIRAIEKKKEVLKELKRILHSRFTDFSSPVFVNMNCVDPKNWKGEKTYGTEQINALITHF